MKKNLLFVSLAYASIFSVTSLMSGCQAIDGLFSESPSYRYRAPEPGSYRVHNHSSLIYQDGYANQGRATPSTAQRSTSNSNRGSYAPRSRYVAPSKQTRAVEPTDDESVITPVGKVTPVSPSPSAPVNAVPTQAPTVPSVAPTVGQ